MLYAASLFFSFWMVQPGALGARQAGQPLALQRLDASSTAELQVIRDQPGPAPGMLRGFSAGPYAGNPEQVSAAFLAEYGPALGLISGDRTWVPTRQVVWRGRRVVHLAEQFRGLPVLGGTVIIRVEPDNTVSFLNARPTSSLHLDTTPLISEHEALAVARAALPAPWADHESPALAVLPSAAGGRLIYQLRVEISMPPATWRVRVDARTGELLEAADQRVRAGAQVYEHNPVNSDLMDVDLPGLDDGAQELEGAWAWPRSRRPPARAAVSALASARPRPSSFSTTATSRCWPRKRHCLSWSWRRRRIGQAIALSTATRSTGRNG